MPIKAGEERSFRDIVELKSGFVFGTKKCVISFIAQVLHSHAKFQIKTEKDFENSACGSGRGWGDKQYAACFSA